MDDNDGCPLGIRRASRTDSNSVTSPADASCTVCGRPDDNLSVPLGRCWSCIKAASAAWEAKIAADRATATPLESLHPTDANLPVCLRRRQPDVASPVSSVRDAPRRLRGLLRTMNDAQVGTRNATLHWVACRVGEMIATGELPDARQAADVLAQIALGTGLDPREVPGTIRSGFSKSGVQV